MSANAVQLASGRGGSGGPYRGEPGINVLAEKEHKRRTNRLDRHDP